MSLQILLIALAVAVALILIFRRFSAGRYGTLRPSSQATADYEAFLVDPDLRYYVSGPDLCPNAVMGIVKAWVLDSDLWKPRDLDPAGMRGLVVNMQAKAGQSLSMLHGFAIYDDKGGQIGNWFSLPGSHVTVRITGEHQVVISTPPADANPAP
ncbi:MAG: hypothetical protein ACYDAA_09835 [Syntrophales bacterium]